MEIKYLENKDIDKNKWDTCIKDSQNSLVYGYSWYLDHLADNWDGIIVGDYKAVLPLPFRKKMGIYYLYQPFFMQQLGLFSTLGPGINIDSALDTIPKKFKYWEIQLNGSFKSNKFDFKNRTTFHINLEKSYETIKERYSKDAKKNIRQANSENWQLTEQNNYDLILSDYKNAYGDLNKEILDKDYNQLKSALIHAKKWDCVIGYVLLSETKERMGSAIFLKSKGIMHYILGAPTQKGRKLNATHVLIDLVLRENAATNTIFDFEGSEIPSVASFYRKFGITEHTYYKLKVNKLPFPLNLLKS